MDKMKVEGVVGLTLCMVSLLLHITSVALPSWSFLERGHAVAIIEGLWKYCLKTLDNCHSIPEDRAEPWVKAVRAMEILALLAGSIGTVLVFISAFIKRDERLYSATASIACLAAAVFSLIGFVVYAVKTEEYDRIFSMRDESNSVKLGAAFVLNVMAFVGFSLCFLALLFCSLFVKRNQSQNPEVEHPPEAKEISIIHPTDIQVT